MCEVIERFLDVKVVSFISDENLSFRAMFAFGGIFTSMITVLWSAMPSTTFSFFINPGLFVKTRSRILLAFPCLCVGSLTCWISPCSSTKESSWLAATVLYPLLGVTW